MTHQHNGVRRTLTPALIALPLALAATLSPAMLGSAQAAPVTISDAELRWELNTESISGAYAPGTWNLFSAGKLGNPGAGGQTLTSANEGATWANGSAAGWRNNDGNVTVLDRGGDGSYAPTTWLGARQNSVGLNSNTAGITSENLLSLTNGTGSVDADTDTGTISWDGDFTVVYYSGMSFFYVSDPTLTVVDGTGKITATLSGYGSDMADQSQWTALPETQVTLADVLDVDLTPTGLSVTPEYLGVTVTPPPGSPAQVTTNPATAGSFPQTFVDFQGAVGTASYWYSSGGAADVRKPTTPLSVTWGKGNPPTAPPTAPPTESPTVTPAPTSTPTTTPTTSPTSSPTSTPTSSPSTTASEKAAGRARLRWSTKPAVGTRGKATIHVRHGATGRATLIVRRVASPVRTLKVARLTTKVSGGRATYRLPRLRAGSYALRVSVPGNDAVTSATLTRTFRVR